MLEIVILYIYFFGAFRVFLYSQVSTIRGQIDIQSKQGGTNNRIQKSANNEVFQHKPHHLFLFHPFTK